MLDYRTSSSPDRPPRPLSERLREETRADHTRAEKHPLMAAMVSGRIDGAGYARYLGQLLHVHLALETQLCRLAAEHRVFGLIVREHHMRTPDLLADLEVLGQCLSKHPPLPATGLFRERIDGLAADAPVGLVGTLYVLEGSTNGGRYIAPAVRRALGLIERGGIASGTEYLDPHGDRQQDRWSFFKASLDVLTLSPAECDLIVAVASDAFRGVHDIFQDLTHPPHAHHPYVSHHAPGPTAAAEPAMTPARTRVRDSVSVCIRRPAEKEVRTTHQP
ncbi:MAG: biliverdin-producing heme oxygenase [Phycisphaeraceae bacterium]|nr:biliverdin-producing heme oxygenase [Phycisphaeraceae bacterium]